MMDFKEEWKRSPEYQPLAHEISDEIWSPKNCNSILMLSEEIWHFPFKIHCDIYHYLIRLKMQGQPSRERLCSP